jgi:c(7)-type cytochrome triheme protein
LLKLSAELLSQGRNRKRFLPFFVLLFLVACSPATRQLFFDVPPPEDQPTEQEVAPSQAQSQGMVGANNDLVESLPPPAIESVLDWETAQAELPEHDLGGVDWPAALELGLIRPRTGEDRKAADAAAFKYDFVIEAKKPKFNAWFPHSEHTPWLGCKNCHGELYPLRRNPTSMKEMRGGASCGACHGKVAFSLKQCKRCHLDM